MNWLRRLLGLGERAADEDAQDAATHRRLDRASSAAGRAAADAAGAASDLRRPLEAVITDVERDALLDGARAALPRVQRSLRFPTWHLACVEAERLLRAGHPVEVSGSDAAREFTVTWSADVDA